MPAIDALEPTEISRTNRGTPLLAVRDLSVEFPIDAGVVQAVDGVSFDIYPGETLALVGESGSGKSVTAMSILRLIESQGGLIRSGVIQFEGRDLLALGEAEVRAVRGNRIAMVFQEPMSSLNPVYTIGSQIGEPLTVHRGLSVRQARSEAIHLLELVNMPDARRRVDEYPHQLSGGMRQRAMLAMALALRPSLLIADEPTTALDVTVQAQILELLARFSAELGMAVLLITHDLGIVASAAQRAIVMYAGRVVEQADVYGLFDNPRHPYSAGLLDSLPRVDVRGDALVRLVPIEGSVPDGLAFPTGCRFHPRCRYRFEPCTSLAPPLALPPDAAPGSQHFAACWRSARQPGLSYRAVAPPEHTERLPPEALPSEGVPRERSPDAPRGDA